MVAVAVPIDLAVERLLVAVFLTGSVPDADLMCLDVSSDEDFRRLLVCFLGSV